MNVDVAYRLSKLRRDKGFSQEALAEKLGVSRQAISKWERAESSPDTDNLIALADLYGMSLDSLLKGSETAEREIDGEGSAGMGDTAGAGDAADAEDTAGAGDAAGAGDNTGDGSVTSDTTGDGPVASDTTAADGTARANDAAANDAATSDGKDHVHVDWRDGLHVHDKHGADVRIGWNGIHVEDPGKNEHVHLGPGGIDVHDSEGNTVRSEATGGYTVNGKHYDSWKDAHEAANEEEYHYKSWMTRFPYAPLAFLAFLLMGIFAGMWRICFVVLLSTAIWVTAASMVDAIVGKRSAKKRRRALTDLVGASSLFAFLMVGLLWGLWHPGWILILVGLVVCCLINAIWKVDDDEDGKRTAD